MWKSLESSEDEDSGERLLRKDSGTPKLSLPCISLTWHPLNALAAVPRSYLWVAINLVSARPHILIHRAASLEHAVLLICLACV